MKRIPIVIIYCILFISFKYSGAQEWTLLSPKPTYQSITSISFPSIDTGYLVTEYNKVKRTFNGGQSWDDMGITFDATHVEFRNNNHGFLTSFNKIYSTDDAGETWQPHLVEPYVSCWETYFYNDTVGFAFGWNGYLAKTTDGGNTWESKQRSSGSGTFYYTEIEFADLNTGYAVGMFDHKNTVLRKSVDGGTSWVDVETTQIPGYVTSVSVLGPDDIWVGAGKFNSAQLPYPASIYHSTDGGVTWTPQIIGESFELPDLVTGVHFFDQLNGFAMNSRQVFSTSDGGQTWNHTFVEPLYGVSINFYAYSWPDPQHGYFAGYGPSMVKTLDGGLTFTNMIDGAIDRYNHVWFNDTLNGIVSGNNDSGATIIYTEDSGDTWNQASFDSIPDWIGVISFADNLNGWITSDKSIYKTSNGGQSWDILYQGNEGRFYGLSTPSLTQLYVFGNENLSKSSDGGITWTDITPEGIMQGYGISGFQFPDSITGYMVLNEKYGDDCKFLKTIDGGETWTLVTMTEYGAIRSIDFCDPMNGIVSQMDGNIFTTHDGGNTWTQVSNINADYVQMINPQTALLAMAGTKVYVSHDGGSTFNTIYTNTESWPYVHTFCFLDETFGFAAGYSGMLQRFTATSTGIKEIDLPTTVSLQKPFFTPNPSAESITILADDYESITIASMDGSIIMNVTGYYGRKVNIAALKPGMYLITLQQNSGRITQKLLKY